MRARRTLAVIAGREAGEAWARHAAHRSARCRSRQRADPRRSEQCRERRRARVRRRGRRLRLCPSGDGSRDRARRSTGVHLDWRRRQSSSISVRRRGRPPASSPHYVKAKGLAPAAVNIRFGFDPLGAMADAGRGPASPGPSSRRAVTALIAEFVAQGFAGPFCVADGRPVHAAGGSEAQELAFALANAVAYLRALEAQGIVARRRAPLHLLPPRRRPGPVPHHRQVPRDPEALGARRAGVRA